MSGTGFHVDRRVVTLHSAALCADELAASPPGGHPGPRPAVLSTDRSFTLRPPAGATTSLRTRHSLLRLPVAGGRPSVRQALGRAGPQA